MVDLHGNYEPRRIAFQELWNTRGWTLKVYGIAYEREVPTPSLVDAIKKTAERMLPNPPVTSSRYGVGFICAHQGRTCDVAFVDWWEDEDELHHHMFISDHGSLRPAEGDEFTACSWDLVLLGFERAAWVDAILKNSEGPDLDRYLALRMDDRV